MAKQSPAKAKKLRGEALHGVGPNVIRILINEMKKSDLSFRK